MEIKEFQKKADEIINSIDGKLCIEHNVNSAFMHLIEEIGEVANQLNKPNIRNEEIEKQKLAEELSDVLLFIARIANIYGIDLEDAIKGKINKLKQKWGLDI